MTQSFEQSLCTICAEYSNDRSRLMDIVSQVQQRYRHVSTSAMQIIGRELGIQPVEVRSVASFYAFFSEKPLGKIIIRVCDDVVDKMFGADQVREAFETHLGIRAGETTEDGEFTLELTPCIGMCDQAPAILINEVVLTQVTSKQVAEIVTKLKKNGDPQKLISDYGDGNNAHELVRAMVHNNIRKQGDIIFGSRDAESGLNSAMALSPEEVIQTVKKARLRGRGGAGFPTGMKWDFTRKAEGQRKFVICNADEGEPGTFKDRVLLTENVDLLLEGMTIAGYAIGAEEGIIYLRAEYMYLRNYLQSMIEKRMDNNLLGNNILGKKGFDFRVRIQMGGGAYICGEESALISSCEGLRGDPKTRPPFPAQKGYLGCPTSVNNVETLCAVACILDQGAEKYQAIGTPGSSGTKLLSISGDCEHPGVYEFPIGVSIKEILSAAGAKDTQAVLVGGPSGQFVNPDQFDRVICFDDLSTGGAVVIFNKQRDLIPIVGQYLDFFIEESCGYCTPCRAGTVLMRQRLQEILAGRGQESDLNYLLDLGQTIKKTSRCGLGQTACNPVLSTLKNFPGLYGAVLTPSDDSSQASFDIFQALQDHETLAGRKSEIFKH